MSIAYIIAEGSTDAFILKRLLPEELLAKTRVVTADGSSAAVSDARTILALSKEPVALVVDANTDNKRVIAQRHENLTHLLTRAAPGIPCGVFFAVPTIETVFFVNEQVVEELTGTKPLPIDMETAGANARKVLETLLLTSGRRGEPVYKLEGVSPGAINQMREHQLIRELASFIRSVTQGTSA